MPCPFLADIACHYVSLCRSLIFRPPPSFLFPSATGESTGDPGVFIIIIIIFPIWRLSYNKHSVCHNSRKISENQTSATRAQHRTSARTMSCIPVSLSASLHVECVVERSVVLQHSDRPEGFDARRTQLLHKMSDMAPQYCSRDRLQETLVRTRMPL